MYFVPLSRASIAKKRQVGTCGPTVVIFVDKIARGASRQHLYLSLFVRDARLLFLCSLSLSLSHTHKRRNVMITIDHVMLISSECRWFFLWLIKCTQCHIFKVHYWYNRNTYGLSLLKVKEQCCDHSFSIRRPTVQAILNFSLPDSQNAFVLCGL